MEQYTPVNIKKILSQKGYNYPHKQAENLHQSSFFNPITSNYSTYGNLKCADRSMYGDISCKVLRRVSKKAFIINICINHVLKKIKPFLKPATATNKRGFVIVKAGEDASPDTTGKTEQEIQKFILNTGHTVEPTRDRFQRFALKIVRDCLEIDQVATEIGYRRNGNPCSFYAVDAASILKVLPDQHNPNNIEFVQVIDGMPQAYFPAGTLLLDYMNPRTDIDHPFYGYSAVDQVIDLVTASINTFAYNAGFFVENKLPRGMLLTSGDMDTGTIERMEDYIADIMSGGPEAQWRIPIIPAGGSGDNARSISWVPLGSTSREMEFQQWLDYQTSCIVAMFGCSMDELGLQSNKSQALFEHAGSTQIKASKGTILGDVLGFLQDYMNRILELFYPGYALEFVGYETDDPKAMADLAKAELESYATLNEVREAKGKKKLEHEWADIPLNPQAVQLYNSAKMQEQAGGGMGGLEDMGEDMDMEDDDGSLEDYGESEDDVGGDVAEESPETPEQGGGFGEEPDEVAKSLTLKL